MAWNAIKAIHSPWKKLRITKLKAFITEGLSNNDALPEIGDILRPRSIWHAVSNYQDGGIKKAVHRKNKD